MKNVDPLEEIYKIKDDLAREAGYDIHKFFEQLDAWAKEHPHPPELVVTAEELRRMKEQAKPIAAK
jgi:hypothetical protein